MTLPNSRVYAACPIGPYRVRERVHVRARVRKRYDNNTHNAG